MKNKLTIYNTVDYKEVRKFCDLYQEFPKHKLVLKLKLSCQGSPNNVIAKFRKPKDIARVLLSYFKGITIDEAVWAFYCLDIKSEEAYDIALKDYSNDGGNTELISFMLSLKNLVLS